jgi:protein-tyrosine-phosphatase
MKSLIAALILAFCFPANSSEQKVGLKTHLFPKLQAYAEEVTQGLDKLPEPRKIVLSRIADDVLNQLKTGKEAKLTFICTHNSRRSHMSQIWLQTAAYFYRLDKIDAYSGGTEATACNCRTITAMRRAGFEIEDATTGENPLYLVRYCEDRRPIRAYSKLYNTDENPKAGFIALMTCSSADKSCPIVVGSIARHAIHYSDPKVCDDTPSETKAYNEKCREIAGEMFYIMAQVRRQIDATAGTASPN